MSIIEGTVVGADTGFYPYEIEQSLRFNDNDSAYLSRTPASDGNRKTWTFSTWVKRGNLGSYQTLLCSDSSPSGAINFSFGFSSSDAIYFDMDDTVSSRTIRETSAKYRDPLSWLHIVFVVDTTQATDSNRVKVYVNGQQITFDVVGAGSWPAQNSTSSINSTYTHTLGVRFPTYDRFSDIYLAETHLLDGIAVTDTPTVIRGQTVNFIDEFVELKNGVPVPKAYSGSYGSNGFYLDYSNGASIGADSSGNGNNWTPTNLASTDVMLDSPTNNFATLNSVYPSSTTLAEGNLVATTTSAGTYTNGGVIADTIGMVSGKWYAEMVVTSYGGTYGGVHSVLGIFDSVNATSTNIMYYADGQKGVNASFSAYGASYTSGDVIGVAVDLDANTCIFYKNGVSQGTISIPTTGRTYSFGVSDAASTEWVKVACNFGQDSSFAGNKTPQGYTDANGRGDFYYAPPAGYLALCTANLPEPAIGPNSSSQSDEHFNTVLYSGDSTSSHAITGVGFQPDLVWTKERSTAFNHGLYDVIRGSTKGLASNAADAEYTQAESLKSFDVDGFTLGNWVGENVSGTTYVAWNWKANGSGVTNTDGSITSTVSANVDAGFSIVSWQNNNTANQTIGHGLNQTPEFIITKDRDNGTYNWACWFTGFTANEYLLLNTTGAKASYSSLWGSTPTASVFSIGSTGTGLNAGTDNMIAYVGHSVEGFSKVFSYTGNGSTDGPFQNLGFRPAWIMIKRTDSTNNWYIHDTARDTENVSGKFLYPNLSNAEADVDNLDILSNGFKLRTTATSGNASGGTYIGIAFAENPFKYSNAR